MTPNIVLAMIVKNEEKILGRCLASVEGQVDRGVIYDTGSTDGTQAVWHGSPFPAGWEDGEFRDFSQARNAALRSAEPVSGYTLMLDADHTLEVRDPGWKGALSADVGLVQVVDGNLTYWLPLLRKAGCDLWYKGATHEYLEMPAGRTQRVEGIIVHHHADGGSKADKFSRDERLLRKALEDDPDDLRSLYYLAQTYRCQGKATEAYDHYRARSHDTAGWEEERWHASLCAARLYAEAVLREMASPDDRRRIDGLTGHHVSPFAGIAEEYLKVWAARPTRSEPIADLLGILHGPLGGKAPAGLVGRLADLIRGRLPPPEDILFVEQDAYTAAERLDWMKARDAGHWHTAEMIAGRGIGKGLEPRVWWARAGVQSLWNAGMKKGAIELAERASALAPDDDGLLQDLAAMRAARGSDAGEAG